MSWNGRPQNGILKRSSMGYESQSSRPRFYALSGTKTEISFQTTHQLNDDLQGAISTSYSPLMGAGLTLSSTQILTGTARATASLVLSPAHQAGVQLALNQRTEDISISTKVQVTL